MTYSTRFCLSELIGFNVDAVPNDLLQQNRRIIEGITTISFEDLAAIANLMYKIKHLDLIESLWLSFRKSGTGDILTAMENVHINRSVWSTKFINRMMDFYGHDQHIEDNKDKYCLKLINYCLQQLEQRKQEYHQQLTMKTSYLFGYTSVLEYYLQQCVESALIYRRIETERDIALVYFKYINVLLRRAYLAQFPSSIQVKCFSFCI